MRIIQLKTSILTKTNDAPDRGVNYGIQTSDEKLIVERQTFLCKVWNIEFIFYANASGVTVLGPGSGLLGNRFLVELDKVPRSFISFFN